MFRNSCRSPGSNMSVRTGVRVSCFDAHNVHQRTRRSTNWTATVHYMNSSSLPFYTFRLYKVCQVLLLVGGKYKDLEETVECSRSSLPRPEFKVWSGWWWSWCAGVCQNLNWTWGDRQEYNIERTGKWTTWVGYVHRSPRYNLPKKNWQKKNSFARWCDLTNR